MTIKLLVAAIVKLGGFCGAMASHPLSRFQVAAILEKVGDPGSAESMVPDRGGDAEQLERFLSFSDAYAKRYGLRPLDHEAAIEAWAPKKAEAIAAEAIAAEKSRAANPFNDPFGGGNNPFATGVDNGPPPADAADAGEPNPFGEDPADDLPADNPFSALPVDK